MSPRELTAVALVVQAYADEHGEDLIGALVRTSGSTVLSDPEVVRLAATLASALPKRPAAKRSA